VHAADIALASIFDAGPHTVDVGQARVAHRLRRGDRAEQANALMAAGRSLGATTTSGTLHSQNGRSSPMMPPRDLVPAVPEVPPVAWAVGAAIWRTRSTRSTRAGPRHTIPPLHHLRHHL
jgi:hypothetical protein